jgi:hypothetical protein
LSPARIRPRGIKFMHDAARFSFRRSWSTLRVQQ